MEHYISGLLHHGHINRQGIRGPPDIQTPSAEQVANLAPGVSLWLGASSRCAHHWCGVRAMHACEETLDAYHPGHLLGPEKGQ